MLISTRKAGSCVASGIDALRPPMRTPRTFPQGRPRHRTPGPRGLSSAGEGAGEAIGGRRLEHRGQRRRLQLERGEGGCGARNTTPRVSSAPPFCGLNVHIDQCLDKCHTQTRKAIDPGPKLIRAELSVVAPRPTLVKSSSLLVDPGSNVFEPEVARTEPRFARCEAKPA